MGIKDTPHGIHPSIASSVYHEHVLGMVSSTALAQVHRSGAHYRAWLDAADESTPTLEFGSAFHCALLEPAVFAAQYVVQPEFGDCRFKEAKAKRDAWRAANVGKLLVSAEDDAAIRKMIAAVHAHPLAGKMIRGGEPELTLRWRDESTGLECKARLDYYVRGHEMVVDVKSALDAGPTAFAKAIANQGYARQAALYLSGCRAVKLPARHFLFVAVEKEPPYAVAVYALDDDAMARGHHAVRADMERLAECLRTNSFPGYSPGIQTISLPPWAA